MGDVWGPIRASRCHFPLSLRERGIKGVRALVGLPASIAVALPLARPLLPIAWGTRSAGEPLTEGEINGSRHPQPMRPGSSRPACVWSFRTEEIQCAYYIRYFA